MEPILQPLDVPTLKEACIRRLEGLILSGALEIGQRLPPERELAATLGVSRPVVHHALVDLQAKGLVNIVPRKGVYVADYHTHGSCALLSSLLSYSEGELAPSLMESMSQMRLLMETETARLAALHRTGEQMAAFETLLAQEGGVDREDVEALVALDFDFHRLVALASGNVMYTLIINSFEPVYKNLTRSFFTRHRGDGVLEVVFDYHERLVAALRDGESETAGTVMEKLLRHGARYL